MRISVDDTAEADAPVIITAAGKESVTLCALIRQAIPMLAEPERHSPFERRQLAQTLTAALELDDSEDEEALVLSDLDAPPEPDEYEPGCLLEAPWA
jgi:hypothetical protein